MVGGETPSRGEDSFPFSNWCLNRKHSKSNPCQNWPSFCLVMPKFERGLEFLVVKSVFLCRFSWMLGGCGDLRAMEYHEDLQNPQESLLPRLLPHLLLKEPMCILLPTNHARIKLHSKDQPIKGWSDWRIWNPHWLLDWRASSEEEKNRSSISWLKAW